MVDAIADNYPMSTVGQPRNVLAGLHGILSSSRGGNKTLLGLLNSKMAAVCPDLRLLVQPSTVAASQPILSSGMPDEDGWDWITSAMGEAPNQYDLDQMAQLAWPPLDLGNLLRSPSPLTRMLMDQAQPGQQP